MNDFLTDCARDPEAQAYFLGPAHQLQSTDPMRPNNIGLGAYALVVPFQCGMGPAEEPQLSGDASVSQSRLSPTLYSSPTLLPDATKRLLNVRILNVPALATYA